MVDGQRVNGPTAANNKPLTGARVLDLGRHLAGPTCAMWLGDLGADVIKIENPERGEDGRAAAAVLPAAGGESAFFLSANRNKRSLAMDIKGAEGSGVVPSAGRSRRRGHRELPPERHGGAQHRLRPGLERNPRIIYCSISGFGPDGPFADRPGLDQIIQGFSGLMSVTGFEGGEPTRVGIPIADLLTGLFGAYGVLAALQARAQTGRGQVVTTSLMESMVGMMGFQATRYLNGGGVPPPAGNHHPINAPYGVFKTRDGYITIGATGEKKWPHFCRVIAATELLADPRFKTNGGRFSHRLELAELIGEKLQAHTSDEWERILNAESIPCGPIYTLDKTLEHPQVHHREMVVEGEHSVVGTVRLLGLPVKLSGTPVGVERVPPTFGQHTDEILTEFGLDAGELERLRTAGTIRSGPRTVAAESGAL